MKRCRGTRDPYDPAMRIALTGANGFIGRAIVRHLQREGYQVRGLVRQRASAIDLEASGMEVVESGLADLTPGGEVMGQLLDGADVVVHNAFDWAAMRDGPPQRHHAVNVIASLDLITASAPRPFVYLSSVAVHHEMLEQWGGRVDESHPTRPGSAYGAAKVAVEAHLFAERAVGRPVCMLRPAAVYGIDPDLSRTIGWPIVQRIRETRAFSRPGGGKFVHVDDVAAAVLGALRLGEAAPPVAHLADCFARWGDLAQWSAEIMGITAEIDLRSPAAPKNEFTKDAARSLGARLDRGHDGLRAHLREVVALAGC